jgi:hypothetical protein
MNRRHSYSQADWLDDQRHQPVPEDEDTWRERMRERKLDDAKSKPAPIPPKPVKGKKC